MSNLALPSGEDFPDAAAKHLQDAEVLLVAKRSDGVAYLSGYVVECSLKSLLLCLKRTQDPSALQQPLPWMKRGKGHAWPHLQKEAATLAALADPKIAKYLSAAVDNALASSIQAWRPDLRYRPPHVPMNDAEDWLVQARVVFRETIAEMKKDGVI